MKIPGKSFLHNLAHLLGLSSPQTQTSEAERRALGEFATKKKRAVEIGVFEGASTRLIAESIHSEGLLFAVDPFFGGRLGICWGEGIARREIHRSGFGEKVKFVKSLSQDAISKIDGLFDFLFIDGDHSLNGIQRDWAAWSPRIESGGFVLLHDTQIPMHNPSVEHLGSYQFFQKTIKFDSRFVLVQVVDSLSVLKRK